MNDSYKISWLINMLKILNSISNDNKELFERALNIRKSEWGNTVTYSRKVFVPLTIYLSPLRIALVFNEARSDPDPGSEYP